MKGKMDDVAGRVWTWMAMQESPRNAIQVMVGIEHFKYKEVLEALKWWVDNKEMMRHTREDVCYYEIIFRKDPCDDDNG